METKNTNESSLPPGLVDMTVLERVAPVIRTAAHPLRLRILDYLRHVAEPRTVTQIIAACGVEQAIVSQQLRILKDRGILAARRKGTFIYYSIADPSVLFLLDCIREKERRNG